MDESWLLAKNRENLRIRARMIQAIRQYFVDRDYLEVETPNRVPAPAPEFHIDAVPSGSWFLHTSPELCMKRLLAAGYHQIFQICKCYRQGERGNLHLPEFTMLEWYCAGIDYFRLMDDCEDMIRFVAAQLGHDGIIHYGGNSILLTSPWERLTVRAAFERFASCSVDEAIERDCFEETLVRQIEPYLGTSRPTFLYNYPSSMGALARKNHDDPAVAERFELYVAGVELANAFSELADEKEQRERFSEEETLRRDAGKMPYASPEPFLNALAHFPDAAGIAVGLDRLAMVLTGMSRIDDVVTFTPELL